jgi:GTP cyclohydrolase II
MDEYQVEKTHINTKLGEFDFYCFCWGEHEEDNILVLVNPNYESVPLVRVQSACYTAEIFRSLDCDCHAQLSESQRKISKYGGYLIYMLCDGRGAGLLNKVKGMELGITNGLDTSDAYHHLGLKQDPREYNRVIQIIEYFNVSEIRLLTNNPRKVEGINSGNILVAREPLEIESNEYSSPYLETKAKKMGHMLSEFNK